LKLCCAAYRRLETSSEVTKTKYAGYIDVYKKKTEKIGRANDEKAGERAERQDP